MERLAETRVKPSSRRQAAPRSRAAVGAIERPRAAVACWQADNAPIFEHANLLLDKIFPGDNLKLVGNDMATKIMKAGKDGMEAGTFRSDHIIMTGISALWEGVTISYLENVGPLKVLATYNDDKNYNRLAMLVLSDSERPS